MKRKITFLIAALFALTLITQSYTAMGQTYEKLTSIANIDESAQYVLGTYQSSTYYFHYSGTSDWGLLATPASQTPIYYTLTKGTNNADFTAAAEIDDDTYYLTVNNSSNKWNMSKSSTSIWIDPNTGYIYNSSSNTTKCLKRNSDLRSYNVTGNTYPFAYFFKVIPANPTISIESPTNGTIQVMDGLTELEDGDEVEVDTDITLSATPNTGYSFSTWSVTESDSGDEVTLNSATTVASNGFTMPDVDVTVNASFTKNNYNVTLGTPDNVVLSGTDGVTSIAEGGTVAYQYEKSVSLTAGSMGDGKMFAWKVTKTGVLPEEDVTATVLSSVTANSATLTVPAYAVTVSGTVQELKYIVTYKANGGAESDVVEYYSPGANVTVADNAFTYSGHVFKKWNTAAGGGGTDYTEGATISSIAADVTLFAQWADAWTVTLSSNAVTTTIEVEKTQSTTLTTPANVPSGYVFKWWTATPSTPQINVSTTYTPTANVTLYAVFAKTVQEYNEMSVILDGSCLTSTATSSETSKTVSGFTYTFSSGAKSTSVPGTATNAFAGVSDAILIGKQNKYIYNTTPFGNGITKFEVYANKGVSTNVTVGVYFKTTSIDSYSTGDNTWTQKFAEDKVYDASGKMPDGAKYFWFQVTNDYNSQVAFRITYIAPVYYTRIYPSGTTNASEDITISSPTVIQSGTVLNMGLYDLTNTTAANLIIEDGGQLILAKTNTGVAATVKKDVSAATPASKTDATNWYAISAGVANPSILDNTNLITETSTPYHYDLYRFNETKNAGNAWENYRNSDYSATFTTLEKGRGYLYRNASDLTITMTGDINVEDFTYNVTKTGSGEYAGFNLIGNPYTHNIYKGTGTAITNGTSTLSTGFYYLEPSTGKWAKGTDQSTAIAPNQGILVQVNETGNINMTNTDDDGVAKSHNDYIMLSVANSQYSDEAYAWFDEGIGLNKIEHRNSEIPMLYINQNGENFAIATMSDETQSFNLNFKAATMGKYTLSYETKGEYSYLHVIDRLTGEDVDMLMDGEYSFIASPIDSENRFIVRLEYSAGSEISESSIFAYQSGSDIIVNGEGELQIFDMMGRRVSTQYVSGVETINLQLNGVYIFRLNEKTQKIVVK